MSFMQHLWDLLLFGVIVLGPLPACYCLLPRRGGGRSSAAESLIFLTGWWCVVQVSIGLFLGAVQRLSLGWVLGCELLCFAAGLVALRTTAQGRFRERVPGVVAGLWGLTRLEVGLIALIFSGGLVLLYTTWTIPITDYDSLAYHLPAMASWYQVRSLVAPPALSGWSGPPYPYGWEVLCTLCILPFREDFFVVFPNVLAWGLLGVATYGVVRRLGGQRVGALAASCLLLYVPAAAANVNTLHVDLPFAAWFMVALYAGVSFVARRWADDLMLFLAALGMLCGIKTSGLAYGLLLVLGVGGAWIAVRRRAEGSPPPPRLSPWVGVAALACSLFVGCFWYVRNLVQVGNPLGSVAVRLAGHTIFAGGVDPRAIYGTTLAGVFDARNWHDWQVLVEALWKNLHVPFLVSLYGALLLPVALARPARAPGRAALLAVGALCVATWLLYWNTPYSASNERRVAQITPWIGQALRYGFPFVALLPVLAAGAVARLGLSDTAVASVALAGSVLGANASGMLPALITPLAVCVLCAVLGWAAWGTSGPKPVSRVGWAAVGVALAAVVVGGTFVARERRDVERTMVYGPIVEYLERHVPAGEVIGQLLTHRAYLLYGRRLNRRVLHVPAGSDDFAEWVESLRRRAVTLVAAGPVPEGYQSQRELAWLEPPRPPLVRVYGSGLPRGMTLYRIETAEGEGSP